MKWSLLVGKLWGTEIRLHASLLLVIPYALLAFRPANLAGLVSTLALISALFLFVTLHEIGHTLAARLYGIRVSSIVLWPLGGFANLSRRPEQTLPNLFISAAGPLTNLVLTLFLGALMVLERLLEGSMLFPDLSRSLGNLHIFYFLVSLTIANLSLALFNLVPVYPLDGGQIARALLKLVFGEKNADLLMMIFSLPLALGLTILGVVTLDVILILTGLMLLLASITLNPRLLNGLVLVGLYFIDRGGYYLKRLDYDLAVREYSRAIQRAPNRTGPYISRAIAYMNLMELDLARKDVNFSLEHDPENPLGWMLRGELFSLEKNHAAALSAYNHAIQLRPGWAIAFLDRGGRYQEVGDFVRAAQDIDQAVELGRGSPVGYLLRSMLRYEMGNLEGFRADAAQSLRYAPQWMLAFPELFIANLEGHLKWALEYYWLAIQQMPTAYQVFQGRADACRANHHPDWAILDYERAIRLAPRQAELYLGRGRAYLEMGASQQAEADLRQASQLADKTHIRRQAETLLNQNGSSAAPDPATAQIPPAA